jgi:hypothetical protein
MKYYRIILFCVFVFVAVQCSAQTHIQYLIPDAGAPGMSVQVDIIAPKDSTQAFGTDGFAPSNLTVLLANIGDTSRVRIGPIVVRDYGRLLHTVFFINPSAAPGPVPVKVEYNKKFSNTDTFFVKLPDHIGSLYGGYQTLGDGTPGHGKRSKRGTLVVDSLILGGGKYAFSSSDCDPSIFGNQGMLPVTVLVKTKFSLDNASELHLDADTANAAPGGGGGETNTILQTCAVPPAEIPGGAGVAGGSGNGNSFMDGTGSAVGGTALSGAVSVLSGGPSFPFEDATTGGAGAIATVHIVGSDTISGGGGGGGNGSAGINGNSGSPLNGGNELGALDIVPFVGGGGGGGGVAYGNGCPVSGVGGGGGGALMLFASQGIDVEGIITANGADGGAASCNASTSNAGGGGGGAAGSVELASNSPETFAGRVTLSPGISGVGCGIGLAGGQGGNGRLRIDGSESGNAQFVPSVFYHGPSIDERSLSLQLPDTIRGYGNGADSIKLYLLNVNGYSQKLVGPFDTTVSNGTFAFYIPPDSLRKATSDSLVGIIAIQNIHDLYTGSNTWVMGQSSGMIVNLPHGVIALDTSSIDFGNVAVGKTASVRVTLSNTGSADLHVSQVRRHTTFFEDVFTATGITAPFTLRVGGDTTFTMNFSPLDTGFIADSVIFSSNDLGTAAFYLGVQGYGVAPIVQSDSVLAFGEKQINKTRMRSFTVQNTGNGTAKLSQFHIVGSDSLDYSVAVPGDTMSVASGASRKVAVSFTPLTDGVKSAALVFTADDSLKTHTVVLSGEGIDSLVEYPSLICFAPNGSGDTMVQICNGGEDTLVVLAFRLNGAGGITLGQAPPHMRIAPGVCDSVEVRAQLDSQSYSATLTTDIGVQHYATTLMTNCGSASVSEVQPTNDLVIKHYPEPFTDQTIFTLGSHAFIKPNSSLAIFDMLGREVGHFSAEQLAGNSVVFEARYLPAGVYYYRYANGTQMASGEMIHLK